MPTPTVRERVFDALADRLALVTGAAVLRAPLYDLAPEDLPAVALVEGGEDTEDAVSGLLTVTYRATIGLAAGAPGVPTRDAGAAIIAALNGLRGSVRLVLAGDPTLSGLVELVRYTGADDPVFVDGPGQSRPAYGVMVLAVEVRAVEAEDDPRATG